jgi:LacI family transcriptional regulator
MKKSITMKDIAEKLKMSVSTVSKALSDDPTISLMTSERVKKLAKEWNYIPNEAARHFKLSRTYTIGLVIPRMLDEFYILAINGAENIAATEKYNVVIVQSHEDPANEGKIVDLMRRNRVDGVLIAITKNTQDMSPFHNLINIGIPVVFFARPPREKGFDYVTADNESGAFRATEFLINKGHSRIGHLMGPGSLEVSHIRLKGYKKALQKNKISFEPDLVWEVDLSPHSTSLAMQYFMKLKHPPSAIFAFKNYISLDAMDFIKRNYPDKLNEIDFTGFGNLPLFRYLDRKPLASIEENSFEIGLEAAQLLIKKIKALQNGKKEKKHFVVVPSQLVVHEK